MCLNSYDGHTDDALILIWFILQVQIQILTDPHLQGPSDLVESVCIPPRASTARRGEITASGQGEGRVIIRAKSVSDGGCGNKTNGRGVR